MIVYKLSKQQYASDLSGKGAEMYGGRWNSKGIPIVYTSASRALCVAELAVNLALGLTPPDYRLVVIDIPEDSIYKLPRDQYPEDWRSVPHIDTTQLIGDSFILDSKHLVLKVESAVVQDEYNYLINPRHRLFSEVKTIEVQEFRFDSRLGSRGQR